MSVNFYSGCSDVFGIPDNVSVFSHAPFFIDFDKHGGDEAQKRSDVWKDPLDLPVFCGQLMAPLSRRL